jgi:hypothetical protein
MRKSQLSAIANGKEVFNQTHVQDAKWGIIVLVEWDGGHPPTKWYSTLRDMGLHIRSGLNKSESVYSRREGEGGLVAQEGAIIVNNSKAARLLSSLARDMGAKAVMTGTVAVKEFHLTQDDQKVLDRVTAVWGKRGPKSRADEGTYVVTCVEEAQSYEITSREAPVICPHCMASNITYRKGNLATVKPVGKTAFEKWLASRFYTHRYEIPRMDEKLGTSVTVPADLEPTPQTLAVKAFVEANPDLPAEAMYRVMDIAYAVSQLSRVERIEHRTQILSQYYASGGNEQYSLNPSKVIDLVDIAGTDDEFIELLK